MTVSKPLRALLRKAEIHRPCVRSGYCCKRVPCPFGDWNEERTQCAYLQGDRPGEYSCGKYEEILAGAPANGAELVPAFGAGCCSPLNEDRQKLLQERGIKEPSILDLLKPP